MGKAKPKMERTRERLFDYAFDTTGYIVLDTGIHRESTTGRLVTHRERAEPRKPEK